MDGIGRERAFGASMGIFLGLAGDRLTAAAANSQIAGLEWALPLTFGILLLLTLAQSRRPLQGKTWIYLRSLFPSWRFFEDVEPGPVLEFRVESEGGADGSWHAAVVPAQRAALFLNADGNLCLAYQSLVEQLVSELDGIEERRAPSLAPYRFAQRLIEQRARSLALVSTGASYRLRIRSGEDVEFESGRHLFE